MAGAESRIGGRETCAHPAVRSPRRVRQAAPPSPLSPIPAPVISRVKLVSIPVRDQQRAVDFYTTVLGFRVTTDQPMGPGQRWIELTPPGGGTRVVPFTPPGS